MCKVLQPSCSEVFQACPTKSTFPIQYYFYRVEFQHRGSPHIHGLAWIKDTPKFDVDSDGDVCSCVDKIISSSSNVPESDLEFLQLQKHKHSKTCRKKVKGQTVCRFGAPWPPMCDTEILRPLKDEDHQYMEKHKQTNKHVQKFLTDLKPEDYNITFDTFLHKLNVTEEEYITALRSSLKKAKIYLRQEVQDIYINCYIKDMLSVWQANLVVLSMYVIT